jgi:hypothetical protein
MARVCDTVVGRLLTRAGRTSGGHENVEITNPGGDLGLWAAVRSTARKLFDGYVFADVNKKAS